jgi:hypothetical protein
MSEHATRWRLPDGRMIDTGPRFYVASCDGCSWVGSSEECVTDSGPWGDSDVYCPRCHRSGADFGALAAAAVEICKRCGRTEADGIVCLEC